jgi:hypothetical protein
VGLGGVWTQQGSKLVGTCAAGTAGQGASVALSADGNTAIVGGPGDSAGTGAAWVFYGPTTAHDFDGQGILWRNTNGDVAIWLMNGFQLVSELENLLMKARQDTARFCCGI